MTYLSSHALKLRQIELKDRKEFGKRLSKLLLDRGLKQVDVARKMWPGEVRKDKKGNIGQVGRDRISVWCKGQDRPSPLHMKLLCKVLRIKIEDIYPNYEFVEEDQQNANKKLCVTFEKSPSDNNRYIIKSINRSVNTEELLKIIAIFADAEDEKNGRSVKTSQLLDILTKASKAQGKVLRVNLQ